MSRYQTLFQTLAERHEGAFVPFVTLGDPNREQSLAIINTLIAAGADALELGFPFSDPSADGPTIQGASLRALQSGITPTQCFAMLSEIRARHPKIPIGLLMYANLVYARGIDEFYAACVQSGVDSVLIADVPVEESLPFRVAAQAHGIETIFICPPNANSATVQSVATCSQGYTYLLSRAGVTGAEQKAVMPLEHIMAQLRDHNAPPALLGFGIAEPAQVKAALDAGAAGAISGSAVVKVIEQYQTQPEQMLQHLHAFVQAMKAATQRG